MYAASTLNSVVYLAKKISHMHVYYVHMCAHEILLQLTILRHAWWTMRVHWSLKTMKWDRAKCALFTLFLNVWWWIDVHIPIFSCDQSTYVVFSIGWLDLLLFSSPATQTLILLWHVSRQAICKPLRSQIKFSPRADYISEEWRKVN